MTLFQVNVSFPQHFYTTATPNHMDPDALVRQVAGDLRVWQEVNQKISDDNFFKLEKHFQNLENSLVSFSYVIKI